jgi:threonine/homoserine/homoserine lactone efflux protein
LNWTLWWLFVPTEALLCLTPGPAVLLVLATALRAGGRRSIASSLGILAANAVYFLISATSLGALLIASYRLFFLIKWIGAAYLVILGIRTMLGAREPLVPAAELSAKAESFRRRFANGFLLQMSNPKALIFFTALLPQFIDTRFPVAWQVAILGVTSELIEFCVLLGYGLAAGRAAQLARQPRYAAWTNRLSGGMLIGAGAGLAMIRRAS